MTSADLAKTTSFADVSAGIFKGERRKFEQQPHRGIIVANKQRENELASTILIEYIKKSAISNGWGAIFDTSLHVMTAADVAIHEGRRDKVIVLVPGGNAAEQKRRKDTYEEELDQKEKARKALVLNQTNITKKNQMGGQVLHNIIMKCIVLNGYSHVMEESANSVFVRY